MKFVKDDKNLKMKDKLVKDISKKSLDIKSTTYGIPSVRGERPWIIFIDENSQNQDRDSPEVPLIPYPNHVDEKPEKSKIKFEKFIVGNKLEKSKETPKQKPIKESFVTSESVHAKTFANENSQKSFNKLKKTLPDIEVKRYKESILPVHTYTGDKKKREGSMTENDIPAAKRLKSSSRESTPKPNRLGLIGFDLIYGIKDKEDG